MAQSVPRPLELASVSSTLSRTSFTAALTDKLSVVTVASDELVVLRGVALTLPLTGSQLRLAQLACGPSTETPWMTSQPCPCQHRTCFPADPSCSTASRSHCASSGIAPVVWPARCTCTSVRQVSATASYACELQLCFWLCENLIQHCLQWAKPGMRKSLLSRERRVRQS